MLSKLHNNSLFNSFNFFDDYVSNLVENINLNFKDEEGNFLVIYDLPGVKEKDLKVEINDNTISVYAERKDKYKSFVYSKTLTIPKSYDINTLTATLSDGVLTLKAMPLPETKKEIKKVDVKVLK